MTTRAAAAGALLGALVFAGLAAADTVRLGVLQFYPGGLPGGHAYFPDQGPARDAWEFDAATRLAVWEINQAPQILPNHTLEIVRADTAYTASGTVESAFRMLDPLRSDGEPPRIVIGQFSSLTAKNAALVGRLFNTPVFSSVASAPELSDRAEYPTFSRITLSDDEQGEALAHMARHFDWDALALIHTLDDEAVNIAESLGRNAAELGIELLTTQTVKHDTTLTAAVIDAVLDRVVASGARVIVLDVWLEAASPFLLAAHARGLTGAPYVWVGVAKWLFNRGLLAELGPVAQGVVGVTGMEPSPFEPPPAALVSFFTSWATSLYVDPSIVHGMASPNVSFSRYDAVWMAAAALHETVEIERFCASPEGEAAADAAAAASPGAGCDDAAAWPSQPAPLDMCCLLRRNASEARGGNPGGDVALRVLRRQRRDGTLGPLEMNADGESLSNVGIVNVVDGVGLLVGQYDTTAKSVGFHPAASVQWPAGFPAGVVPRALPTVVEVVDSPSDAVVAAVVASASVCAAATLAVLAFNVAFREQKLIRMSSPRVNNVLLLGIVMVCSYAGMDAYRWRAAGTDAAAWASMCSLQHWTLPVAYTLSFGAMFSKAYRVHKIFNNRQLQVRSVRDRSLFQMIAGMLAVDVVLLGAWQLADPLRRSVSRGPAAQDPGDISRLVVPLTYECTSDHYAFWATAIVGYKAALLVGGVWIAYLTRNIKVRALNDSRLIGFAIYNTVVFSLLLMPVALLVSGNVSATTALLDSGVLFAAMVTLAIMFAPKIRKVARGQGNDSDMTAADLKTSAGASGGVGSQGSGAGSPRMGRRGSVGSPRGGSARRLSSGADNVSAENRELRRSNRELTARLAQLAKGGAATSSTAGLMTKRDEVELAHLMAGKEGGPSSGPSSPTSERYAAARRSSVASNFASDSGSARELLSGGGGGGGGRGGRRASGISAISGTSGTSGAGARDEEAIEIVGGIAAAVASPAGVSAADSLETAGGALEVSPSGVDAVVPAGAHLAALPDPSGELGVPPPPDGDPPSMSASEAEFNEDAVSFAV